MEFPPSRQDPAAGSVATAGHIFFHGCPWEDADCEVLPGPSGGLRNRRWFISDSPQICMLRYVPRLYIRKPFQNREVGLKRYLALTGERMMRVE